MDTNRESYGLRTFLEHYWFMLLSAVMLIANIYQQNLTVSAICCFVVALFAAGAGISLIFYAKLPLYRKRAFLTFGSGAIQEQRRGHYRWGYRCVFLAVTLLLFLSVTGY